MNVLKFNPLVWAVVVVLTFAAYFVRINPNLDITFKIAYNIAAFLLMYGALCFENWRLENMEPNWKELCEKMGVVKKCQTRNLRNRE